MVKYAQSKPDFASKQGIALKEAAETVYWLELLQDSGLLTETMSSSMLADANEPVVMLVSAIIAPAMKYVDLPSLVGGAPRAPRNRFTPHFAVFRFRAARGAAPTNTPRINIFPRRIYSNRHASWCERGSCNSPYSIRCQRNGSAISKFVIELAGSFW